MATKVLFVGGIDMEPGWSTAAEGKTWVDGWNAAQTIALRNFGTAEGCAWKAGQPASCNNGWTQHDVWYVSHGPAGHANYGFPEIYIRADYPEPPTPGGIEDFAEANSRQWKRISTHGVNHDEHRVEFRGTLSQQQACIDTNQRQPDCFFANHGPNVAWAQLWEWINSDSATAMTPLYSSDISWRNCESSMADC